MKRYIHILVLLTFCAGVQASGIGDALDEYYDSFAKEDMVRYMAVQYTGNMAIKEIEQKKANIQAIWASLDTKGYELNGMEVEERNDLGLATYLIDTTLSEGEKTFSYRMSMTAVLVNKEGWKVAAVVHTAQFDAVMATESFEIMVPEPEIINSTNVTEPLPIEMANKTVSCLYDKSKLAIESLSLSSIPGADRIGDDKELMLIVDGDRFGYSIVQGTISQSGVTDPDFEILIDSCTMSRLFAGANPIVEYEAGNIKVKGRSIGESLKLGVGKFMFWIYRLFSKEPFEQWVEAESGTLEGKGPYSFIGPTSRGPGELYLGDSGAKAVYLFNSRYEGPAYLSIKVSDDGLHADGARSVIFSVNGKELRYDHKSYNCFAKGSPWCMETIGKVDIMKGDNRITVQKPMSTSAAFTMDSFVLSEQEYR